jgi:4-diphosphocytidyl-2-C-methyl-D-erythritol kinase
MSDERIFARAYAKVNLTLDVLGRRADGYHELASVMQTIALHDVLAFQEIPGEALQFACNIPELAGKENLVVRAAEGICARVGWRRGLRIELYKQVPSPAGLGGGSSDAACVLRTLDCWWHLDLGHEELTELAAALGSDVPFFLAGGTALVEGRGERVTPLPDLPGWWVILVKPDLVVPTPYVFRRMDPSLYSDGRATAEVVSHIRSQMNPPLSLLRNALAAPAEALFPEIADWMALIRAAGAPSVHLSGSGPTLFALFDELAHALAVVDRLRASNTAVYLTHTMTGREGGV